MNIFKEIKGLRHLTPDEMKIIEEFQKTMNEEVIPEIVKIVNKRAELAAKSRKWHLKC